MGAPVVAFRSGRGVVDDDHPLGLTIAAARRLWPETDLSRLAWSGQRKRPVIPCADLGGDTEYGRQVARGGGRGAETRLG
jgi:hypothetical protein